jgi:hypothetical protein
MVVPAGAATAEIVGESIGMCLANFLLDSTIRSLRPDVTEYDGSEDEPKEDSDDAIADVIEIGRGRRRTTY